MDVMLAMSGQMIGHVLKNKTPQMNNCNWRWSINLPGDPSGSLTGVPGMEYVDAGDLSNRHDAMRRVEKYLEEFGYCVLTKRQIALL